MDEKFFRQDDIETFDIKNGDIDRIFESLGMMSKGYDSENDNLDGIEIPDFPGYNSGCGCGNQGCGNIPDCGGGCNNTPDCGSGCNNNPDCGSGCNNNPECGGGGCQDKWNDMDNCCCNEAEKYIGDAHIPPEPESWACSKPQYNKNCFYQDGNCDDKFFPCIKPKKKAACLQVCKWVDETCALDGETLTYKIKIRNTGNTAAFNITLVDILPDGLEYVECSLKVKGCNVCYQGDLSGLSLGSILPCEEIKIRFQAQIECNYVGTIQNSATVNYCYAADRCGKDIVCTSAESNTVCTTVTASPIELVKSVDKSVVAIGDTLTYTIVATNTGAAPAENLTIKDALPDGICCQCVEANGTTYSCAELASGIDFGDVAGGDSVTITVNAVVTDFPDEDVTLDNVASATYTRNGQVLCPTISNVVPVEVILYLCKPTCVNTDIRVCCNNGPVHCIEDARAKVKILDVEEECGGCPAKKYKKVKVQAELKLYIKFANCAGCEKRVTKDVDFCIGLRVPQSFEYKQNYCISMDPKEICTRIRCGFNIEAQTKILVCLTSI